MSSTSTSQAGYTMPTLSITTLFTLALFFTQVAAQGWILPQMPQLGVFRMDPIVNPGAVSSHVHNVVGASRFDNVVRDPSYNQGSTCSSISLQADKSMYWAPQLYYRREDNTYTPMMGNSRIYYFIKGDNVQPFPPNLRMLSGTPMKRNLSDVRTIGLGLSCSGHGRGHFLPNSTTFPNGCGGLSLGIFFPSCGLADGSLDSDDHASHMTWPVTRGGGGIPGAPNPNNGDCPKSHPIKYPTIFMEHNYYFGGAQPWRNEPNLIVLSNGDTLGSSYHGDFINGWDQGVLSSAIKGCRTSDNLAACSMFKPHINNQAATECRLESKIPAENVGLNEPLKNLPGCNPLWTANMGDKPTCDRAPAEPGFVYPNVYFNNLQYGSRWPIADPRANASLLTDRFRPDNYISLAPTWMGKPNESAIKKWGAQAFNKVLQVGTIPQILAAWVGNDGIKGSQTGIAGAAPVGSASAGAASASASQSSTTSKATSQSSQSSASAASTSSSSYSDDDDGWYSTSSQLPSATKNAVIIGQPSSLPKASGSVKNLATAAPSPSSAASVKSTASASATSSVAALVKNIASASLKPSSAASGKSTVSASATTSKASSASSVKSTGTTKASSASSAARAASSGTAKPTSAGTSCKRSSKKRSAHSKRRLNMEKRRHTARFAE